MVIRIRPVFFVIAALIIVFAAATAAMSEEKPAEGYAENTEEDSETVSETVNKSARIASETEPQAEQTEFIPRLSAPSWDNACYYSSDNIFYASGYGMPNCTCYAWGRAYELSGKKPELSTCDACTWYDYNLESGAYDCGSEPREGAIACFAYASGGSGHVAVVEEIGEDELVLSNSAYLGTEFYTERVPADDPTNGRGDWIFQGYIYI